jgi:hypothetical protein
VVDLIAPQTAEEIMAELRSDSRLNKARAAFSANSARIEQASQQRRPLSPVDIRKMEFEAVGAIAKALEVTP